MSLIARTVSFKVSDTTYIVALVAGNAVTISEMTIGSDTGIPTNFRRQLHFFSVFSKGTRALDDIAQDDKLTIDISGWLVKKMFLKLNVSSITRRSAAASTDFSKV